VHDDSQAQTTRGRADGHSALLGGGSARVRTDDAIFNPPPPTSGRRRRTATRTVAWPTRLRWGPTDTRGTGIGSRASRVNEASGGAIPVISTWCVTDREQFYAGIYGSWAKHSSPRQPRVCPGEAGLQEKQWRLGSSEIAIPPAPARSSIVLGVGAITRSCHTSIKRCSEPAHGSWRGPATASAGIIDRGWEFLEPHAAA